MDSPLLSLPDLIKNSQQKMEHIKSEIGKRIVGQTHLVNSLLIALFADGHLLVEGVPGLAKTLAINTLAKALDCDFKRIQFTPDLLPTDLIGTQIYNIKEGTFSIKKGPIFTNLLLADEINRAPAKVQSALLEVMQERQVTIAGETFYPPKPFLVMATQNPIEQEGTYPLAEAQTDRFMLKVRITYPDRSEEKEILDRMGTMNPLPAISAVFTCEDILNFRQIVENIYIDEKVTDYLLNVIQATRYPEKFGLKDLQGMIEYGASPRASIAMKQASKARAFIAGRYFVTPQDIKDIAYDVLRHRLRLSYEAEAENLTPDKIIEALLNTLPVP